METPATGEAMQALRRARGLSLRQLADKARVSAAALSRWESQKRVPSIPELEAVLTVLEASEEQKRAVLRGINAPRAVLRLRTLDQTGTEFYATNRVGDLLLAMRQRKGWTQNQTARAAQVAQAQIVWWEKGEAVPGTEALHTLCWALEAHPEEVAALTTSGSSGGSHSFGAVGEQTAQKWDNPTWAAHVHHLLHHPSSTGLFVLMLIAAEHQLSLLAADPARHHFAVGLLADVYGIHARHHVVHQELRQSVPWAERSLTLQRRRLRFGMRNKAEAGRTSFWFGSVLAQAAYVSHTKRPAGLRQAVRLLQNYLPALDANDPHYAWGQMRLAAYLLTLGRVDEAVTLGRTACKKGEQINNNEGFMRWRDFAHLLLKAKRPEHALGAIARSATLRVGPDLILPDTTARQHLLEAECLKAVGDTYGAGERARSAEKIIAAHDLNHLQADLRRVAEGL